MSKVLTILHLYCLLENSLSPPERVTIYLMVSPAIALIAVYRVYHTIAWVDIYPVYRGSFPHCLPSQPRVPSGSGSLRID
jgi:hypothetical protein